ncbi:MAG: hypothetical protein P0S96_02665 [Simkaniaceae bacterium]|nr:hypothetical protein [Candidatus Sacchlamyda saccharinae]
MSKGVWIFLLGLTGFLALWRGGEAGWMLWQFNRLEMDVPAEQVVYEVIPKRSKYSIAGIYSYVYKGQEFSGKSVLSGPKHLNRVSAELEIKRMEGMDRTVWLNTQKPSISSLESDFPLREVLYGLCTIGVFVYFLYLFIFYRSRELS